MKYSSLLFLSLFTTFSTVSTAAYAGVVIGGTRLIYDGAQKESTISVTNPDKSPYLIQSWVEQENSTQKAPFIVTPPLFRLDGDSQNVLRVIRTGNKLSEQKESLYWLNIKAIPSAPKGENTLQIAIKTRIKLIYRPASLKNGNPEKVANTLQFKKSGKSLVVVNPTPYYMNFQYLNVNGKELKEVTYISPQSVQRYDISGQTPKTITWKIINDYGSSGKEYSFTF